MSQGGEGRYSIQQRQRGSLPELLKGVNSPQIFWIAKPPGPPGDPLDEQYQAPSHPVLEQLGVALPLIRQLKHPRAGGHWRVPITLVSPLKAMCKGSSL